MFPGKRSCVSLHLGPLAPPWACRPATVEVQAVHFFKLATVEVQAVHLSNILFRTMSAEKFSGAVGMWVHPGRKPVIITIDDAKKISFAGSKPHGKVFTYTDDEHDEDLLLMMFNGKKCEATPETMKVHVLRRVSELIYRDVHGVQFVAWMKDTSPMKRRKLSEAPTSNADGTIDFVKHKTFAWLHSGRPMQFLHLGYCAEQPRVIFEQHRDKEIVFSPPHGDWIVHNKLSNIINEDPIQSVSKDSPAFEVSFHHSGQNEKAFTMVCGNMAQCPSLFAVVAWKNASTSLHVYSDCELGACPAKNIYTFEM